MIEFIKAHHKAAGGQTTFAETAFVEVWEPLGWERGWPDEEAEAPAEQAAPVAAEEAPAEKTRR